MPLPFLIGAFASIKNGEKKKGSSKEAVRRHNGNLEKLRIKESECSDAVKALRAEQKLSLTKLAELTGRLESVTNAPNFDLMNVSAVKLVHFDTEGINAAAKDPDWYLSTVSAGNYLVSKTAALSLSDTPVKTWEDMETAEKEINGFFRYYDCLQITAEQLEHSIAMVRDIFEKHLTALDQLKEKNGKIDWNTFGNTQRFAYQNTVQLAVLIYEMCSLPLVKDNEGIGDVSSVDAEGAKALLSKARALCQDKGFDYDASSFDVILRGSAKDYFSYRYRLEDKLGLMLPLSREQIEPILTKLRMDQNVMISRDVTHLHARAVLDKLRDVDIKSQRVPSPDGSSVYYIDLV